MKAKVLIADDSAPMRMILKEILVHNGCEITDEAENGKEAVEMYSRHKPDVVILDLSMPVMDGIDALKAIKELHPDVCAVMQSAMGQQNLVVEAIRAGAAEFFIKPLQSERVVEALEKALKKKLV